jgi:hypothetical protein
VQLTDFTSESTPVVDTCSLSQLTALTPNDIIDDLRLLLIVVATLFGAMILGAALGWALDARERHAFVAQLQRPEVGFRAVGDKEKGAGAWLWAFRMEPLTEGDELARPSGTAVALASLLGVPHARLRLALPDELLSWSVRDALGRRSALSATGLAASLQQQQELEPALWAPSCSGGKPAPASGKIPVTPLQQDDVERGVAPDSLDAEVMDTFVGTGAPRTHVRSSLPL